MCTIDCFESIDQRFEACESRDLERIRVSVLPSVVRIKLGAMYESQRFTCGVRVEPLHESPDLRYLRQYEALCGSGNFRSLRVRAGFAGGVAGAGPRGV